jgi:hypothetical protein
MPQATITLSLNTQLTSRLFGAVSEAMLLIDEPTPAQMVPCTQPVCNVQGTGGNLNEFKSGNPNLFAGAVSANTVTFAGVPIDPPPAGASRIYRFTNIRANALAVARGSGGNARSNRGLAVRHPGD